MVVDPAKVLMIERNLYELLVADGRRIKVALLVARLTDIDVEDPVSLIDAALEKLAHREDVKTFGNITRWRHSEISRSA